MTTSVFWIIRSRYILKFIPKSSLTFAPFVGRLAIDYSIVEVNLINSLVKNESVFPVRKFLRVGFSQVSVV